MSLSLTELEKAHQSLKTAVSLLQTVLKSEPNNIEMQRALRDSCIQRFEFCVELSWKISIKLLGLQTRAPNPAIRDMAQNGVITDTALWFGFLESRNKTSHSYDEEIAKQVYADAIRMIDALEQLIINLRKLP